MFFWGAYVNTKDNDRNDTTENSQYKFTSNTVTLVKSIDRGEYSNRMSSSLSSFMGKEGLFTVFKTGSPPLGTTYTYDTRSADGTTADDHILSSFENVTGTVCNGTQVFTISATGFTYPYGYYESNDTYTTTANVNLTVALGFESYPISWMGNDTRIVVGTTEYENAYLESGTSYKVRYYPEHYMYGTTFTADYLLQLER
jgi:hypothetical protein